MSTSDGTELPFIALIAWLRDLGEAFNAVDRGYLDEANRMRAEAYTGIRKLVAAHPEICDALPGLRETLEVKPIDLDRFMEPAQAHIDAIRAE